MVMQQMYDCGLLWGREGSNTFICESIGWTRLTKLYGEMLKVFWMQFEQILIEKWIAQYQEIRRSWHMHMSCDSENESHGSHNS